MSDDPSTPTKKRTQQKHSMKIHNFRDQEDNNNVPNKTSDQDAARSFAIWYKKMIDHDRNNIGLYLSDEIVLEWFGRTIRTHKKVTWFLKNDMHCSRHDFSTIESRDKIITREDKAARTISFNDDYQLAIPLKIADSPDLMPNILRKRTGLRSSDKSPIEASSKDSGDEFSCTRRKKMKTRHQEPVYSTETNRDKVQELKPNKTINLQCTEGNIEINNKGDGALNKFKRKSSIVTPPNKELGQGDCLPSTSGTDSMSDLSHLYLYSQMPRKVVACNGYIEFSRTRNNSANAMKWDRKCKIQILYSEDQFNVGEYIIWEIYYSDESKCRRNLLAAFEKVSKDADGDY